MSQHKYNDAYNKGFEDGKKKAFDDWVYQCYDELTPKEQIELLLKWGADLPQVQKGKWIDTEPDKDRWDKSNAPWKCSCCGHRAGKDKYKTYKFCPWCGAKMESEEE